MESTFDSSINLHLLKGSRRESSSNDCNTKAMTSMILVYVKYYVYLYRIYTQNKLFLCKIASPTDCQLRAVKCGRV